MSSGNKLSVSICDDNGNLSYRKQFGVRRIIQRGVIDDDRIVSLDMKELGYNWNNSEWVADPDKTTGKFLLVAEYDSSIYDETDLGLLVPMKPRSSSDGDFTVFTLGKGMLYARNRINLDYFFALSGGQGGDTWLDGEKFCFEIAKFNLPELKYETLKFDGIKFGYDGIISARKDISDQTDTVMYLTNAAVMVKSFKGKRWLCITPLIINEYMGCYILFRRNIKGGLIKYSVVEVEE